MQKLNPDQETAKITFSLPAELKQAMLAEVKRRTGSARNMSKVYRELTEMYLNSGIDSQQ